jgi:hypothetical protein
MFKTFKTRVASFSAQHLALAFTLVMSFFFNTLLMAQIEVDVDLNIINNPSGQGSFIQGGLVTSAPDLTSNSYNINFTVNDFPDNFEGLNIDLGNGQTQFIALSGAQKPVKMSFNAGYWDSSDKRITATEVMQSNNHPPATWSGLMKRYAPNRTVASSSYQTPDETVIASGINMHIKYAPSNAQRKLNKPIIFVEGIDFGTTILNDFTGKTVRVGDFGWDTFITGMVDNPESSDNVTFAQLPDFAKQMLLDGYDLVFCDFQDGAALIEDNGRALIAVINEVNSRKKSGLTSKQRCYANTIVGASMGGQVVRWALKTMENENTDHDCSLYYSMDSPHKGANMPLALQSFIWFGANFGPDGATKTFFNDKWQKINKPAARQLIALNISTQGEHLAYMSMMNQLGYPQKTRNIASANGSGTGQNQGYSNTDKLAQASGNINILGLGQVKVFTLDLHASGANQIAKLNRVLQKPTLQNYLNIMGGFMRLERVNSTTVKLSGLQTNVSIAAGILDQNLPGYSSRTIDFGKDISNWDNCPGGNRNDIGGDVVPMLTKFLIDATDQSGASGPAGRQCFIPTVSALDLATNDLHTNASSFVGLTSSPNAGTTPFKSVFVSGSNEPHVFMSSALLTFARNEIIANTKISCGRMIMADPTPKTQMGFGGGK